MRFLAVLFLAAAAIAADSIPLDQGWTLASTATVTDPGEAVSTPAYDTHAWMPAIVPGTVLGAYVAAGRHPEPGFDLNNRMPPDADGRLQPGLIPDASQPKSDFSYAHWYRITFTLSEADAKRTVWLEFGGANWQADLFVNGRSIGSNIGAWKRGSFVISAAVQPGRNCLAVLVHQLPVPGTPCRTGGGEAGLPNIGFTPATIYQSVGWDFSSIDGVRDRDMGILRPVSLRLTGVVAVRDPMISTVRVPGETAELAFRTTLINTSPVAQHGVLDISIAGAAISRPFELAAQETREVRLSAADEPALVVRKPRVWWPNGLGAQELYPLTVSARIGDAASDTVVRQVGIRHIESKPVGGQHVWWINGKRTFLPGGAWVQDAMRRATPERHAEQLRFLAQAGMVWLRLWSGSGPEDDAFFDACDRQGILVWVESGLALQTKVPPRDGPDFKPWLAITQDNWRDTVRRLRHHACVFHWAGCNEGADVEGLAEIVKEEDGLRDYQGNSIDHGRMGNPYRYQSVGVISDRTGTDLWDRPEGDILFAGFNNESGLPCLPTIESLRTMLTPEHLWPIDPTAFAYHDGGGFHRVLAFINEGCREYGGFSTPDLAGRTGAENYAFKGQILGAALYRSLSEGWQRRKWMPDNGATGWALWTANNTHPQVCSRLTSYDLEPNAALYYFAHGNAPLHAQFDYHAGDVAVVNTRYAPAHDLTVRAELRNLDWSLVWNQEKAVPALEGDSTLTGLIAVPPQTAPGLSAVHFVHLELRDAAGKVIDDVIYWRAAGDILAGADGSFRGLNAMPPARLDVTTATSASDGRRLVTVSIRNPGTALAFFVRCKLERGEALVRPCHWDDNWISLAPGATRTLTADCAEAGPVPTLVVEGWNVARLAAAVPGTGTTPELRSTADQANQTLMADASASSTAPGHPASAAVDADPASAWKPAGDGPAWLQADLGRGMAIDRVHIAWDGTAPATARLLVSDDGTAWTPVAPIGGDELRFDPLPARFVRLECTGGAVHDLAVYAPLPAPDAWTTAVGCAATASSSEGEKYPATAATDGKPDTRWASRMGSDSEWLAIDLGQGRIIDAVRLRWDPAFSSKIRIQVSDDGTAWRDHKVVDPARPGVVLERFDAVRARHVRICCDRRGSAWGFSLWEVEVHAACVSGPNPRRP